MGQADPCQSGMIQFTEASPPHSRAEASAKLSPVPGKPDGALLKPNRSNGVPSAAIGKGELDLQRLQARYNLKRVNQL
jgi:hypothetical protein